MSESWYIIWVLLTLTRGSPVRSKPQGFVGKSIILPFPFNGNMSEVTVNCRHDSSNYTDKSVYEITNGSEKAGPEYQGRASSSWDNQKRTFFLKIEKLQKADEGKYKCFFIGCKLSAQLCFSIRDLSVNETSKEEEQSGPKSTSSRNEGLAHLSEAVKGIAVVICLAYVWNFYRTLKVS